MHLLCICSVLYQLVSLCVLASGDVETFDIDTMATNRPLATFAAGCFWGVEMTFYRTPGVLSTKVGYTGGKASNPTYKQVCSGDTGHAEAVQMEFDPEKISYAKLLDVFFQSHDPTTKNKQGPDVGTQYRSAIFYHDDQQKKEAQVNWTEAVERWQPKFDKPIVTEIQSASEFWPAEEYHQKYLIKNEGARCHMR